MTREAASSDVEAPTWEDTLPHFSVREKGARITALPLNAPGMFGFMAVVTFVLWVLAGTAVTLFFHGLSSDNPPPFWLGVLAILYTFLPSAAIGLTAAEARDRFGQRSTANRVAAVPPFAGVAVGLAGAALWVGGSGGGWIAVAGVVCSICAGLAAVAACSGIRYARGRHAWMVSMRHHGTRSPGVLREIAFLEKWSGGHPQFRVVVESSAGSGQQRITANMITTAKRVPRRRARVVVIRAPHDPAAEPLIELDHTSKPDFDPHHAKYTLPSGN